jgi:N-acetylmuramoyl-L-alanine amidase
MDARTPPQPARAIFDFLPRRGAPGVGGVGGFPRGGFNVRHFRYFLLLGLPLIAIACSTSEKADAPGATPVVGDLLSQTMRDRGLLPLPTAPHPRAKFLRGLKVCIDPGHGGDVGPEFERSGYKRGPAGTREAEINLRTSLQLAALLRESGASVLLTRDDDSSVSLSQRSEMANAWGADLFVSVHHNAGAKPEANFSSVWYHATGAEHPAALDVAREMAGGLSRHVALPNAAACGTYSDTLMYREGFAVLRESHMAGVLAECSFFTNPREEELLRDPDYNARVAWALFDGLANWAAGGVPRWEASSPMAGRLPIRLLDGMKEGWGSDTPRIREDTVRVFVDGEAFTDWELHEGELLLALPEDVTLETMIDVRFENRAKNASITPARPLRECLPGRDVAPASWNAARRATPPVPTGKPRG